MTSIARAAGLAALLAGCVGATSPGGYLPEMPTASKCRLGASQTSVLVTEWTAAEKANLEAQMRSAGGVAVAFSGCELRLLPECQLPGSYVWQRTTPGTDLIEIRNEADLYTKLPLGAVALAAELKRSGSLFVQTTVAGQQRLTGFAPTDVPRRAECDRATHVVTGMSLGAFVLTAAGEGSRSASIEVSSIGQAGGRSSGSARIMRAAGNSQTCYTATPDSPGSDCASPVQLFLSPIPGRAEPEGPPGSVRADFVSASGTVRWDVYVDDEATCTTPCSRWIDPERPLVMRSREDAPDKLQVSRFDRSLGPIQISAHPRANGKLATGITFTALGGLALLSGISLTGVGCSSEERSGMCTAGLITMGTGGLVTAGAIWLILQSVPRTEVRPLFTLGPASVHLAPGVVAGTF
jgi:hypothetical protein